MIIRGIDFKFSTLNADDADRMLAAQKKQMARAKTEGSRYTPDGEGYPDFLRFQCRIFMDYLDEVLGEGACEKLGLDGSNFNECLAVGKDFADAMAAEKTAVGDLLYPVKTTEKTTEAIHTMTAEELPKHTHSLKVLPGQPIPAPVNREQRRAAEKAQRAAEAAQQSAAIVLPAEDSAHVVAVNKAARRKQLLAELAELENA